MNDDRLLRVALFGESLLNMVSLYEAERVVAIAQEVPERTFSIGARLNFPLPGLARSRFGIDVKSDTPEMLIG
ncbi:MAG: hypothetical protein KDB96_00150 [Flavobacteriales bacterium]|nr:hypothetical protein [Flavobacteriales bacterium]MCB0778054.1 hypothetical protein [Flavobacteriales bacterium]MCB0807668.1 hypothetical protein [Flavobacteriales bacterium]